MSARTLRFHNDPVAQLDRVSVSEAGGHEFESHRDHHNAKVAELVDALASGASTERRKGSSPFFRTIPPPCFISVYTFSFNLIFVHAKTAFLSGLLCSLPCIFAHTFNITFHGYCFG